MGRDANIVNADKLAEWMVENQDMAEVLQKIDTVPESFEEAFTDSFWKGIIHRWSEMEYWDENLDFMDAVEDAGGPDGSSFDTNKGCEIYDTYARPSAPREVNISSGTRAMLVATFTSDWAASESEARASEWGAAYEEYLGLDRTERLKMRPPAPDCYNAAYSEVKEICGTSYTRFYAAAQLAPGMAVHKKLAADLAREGM